MTEATTTISVSSTDGFLHSDIVTIGNEKIRYTSKSETQFNAPATGGRGYDGTEAETHDANSYVMSQDSDVVNQMLGFNIAATGTTVGAVSIGLSLNRFLFTSVPRLATWDYSWLTGDLILLVLGQILVSFILSLLLLINSGCEGEYNSFIDTTDNISLPKNDGRVDSSKNNSPMRLKEKPINSMISLGDSEPEPEDESEDEPEPEPVLEPEDEPEPEQEPEPKEDNSGAYLVGTEPEKENTDGPYLVGEEPENDNKDRPYLVGEEPEEEPRADQPRLVNDDEEEPEENNGGAYLVGEEPEKENTDGPYLVGEEPEPEPNPDGPRMVN